MFWQFFSSTFGIIFGILMAILAFLFVIAFIIWFGKWLEERNKIKQKKKCPRCKLKKEKKLNEKGVSFYLKDLCDNCKEKLDEDEDEEDEDEEDEDDDCLTTISSSSVKMTKKNGKITSLVVNGKTIK